MSECTHDCNSCGENCAERKTNPEDFRVKLSAGSSVKKVIGVVSGKGGVGKSMVTSLLACASMREGYKTAILDGDITGPSIPKAFGIKENLVGNIDGLILPATTTMGIDMVSVNLMLAKVGEKLAHFEVKLDASEEAKKLLIDHGTDVEYGARPLRRTIQKEVEDPISELILQEGLEKKKVLHVDVKDGKLTFHAE